MRLRFRVTRGALVTIAVVLCLWSLPACGNGAGGSATADKWAGAWVVVNDEGTGFEIEKKDATTYNVHDPDDSNAFDATLSGNTLSGKLITTSSDGRPVKFDVTIALNGDNLDLKIVVDGVKKPILMELKKKEVGPSP